MKQLTPTNLIAVEIPENAYDFEWTTNQSVIPYQPELSYYVICNKTGYPQGEGITIGFSFKILGEVTKEGIQFDVEPYIEKLRWAKPYHDLFSIVGVNKEDSVWWTDNPKESFQSLLQANNVEIPEGNKLLILLKQ